jgi:hypothetical protein
LRLGVKAFLRLPPGLAFTQPNLPFLIQEIIGRLLAEDAVLEPVNLCKKQKVFEGKTILGKTIKIMVLPVIVLPLCFCL